jgi:3-hydroxy-5-methyl-1-naphthoate 3-O-methyltransferase
MTSIEPLAKLTTSMWQFRILAAALKLNVFSIIKEQHSIADIAKEIKTDEDPVERLLNALVAMELIEKKDETYHNTELSLKFLDKESPAYFGDFIRMFEESDASWRSLDEAILNNTAVLEDHDSKLAKPYFTRAMHNNAQAPAHALSEMIDFSNRTHLLDIGAGSGAFSIILTNKNKNLKATIVEQPRVCETAKEYVGNNERIDFLPGSYYDVEFPKHDVALFGQIFHSNSAEQNMTLLQKVFDNIEIGGTLIITEFLLNEDKTGPLFPALFSLNMLKETGEGRAYTFSEISTWLNEIGFKDVRKEHLIGPHTMIVANK